MKKYNRIPQLFSKICLSGIVLCTCLNVNAQPLTNPNINGSTFQLNSDMSDEFNDPSFQIIDHPKWAWSSAALLNLGPGYSYNEYNTKVGNTACQDYTPDVISIGTEGNTSFLRLSVKEITSTCKTDDPDSVFTMPYKLADITGRHNQKEGYFEIRMRIPNVAGNAHKGISANAWLWCVNHFGSPCTPGVWSEIDLAEINAKDNLYTCNVHYNPTEGGLGGASPTHQTMRCGPNNICNWSDPNGHCVDTRGDGNPFDGFVDGEWHIYSTYWTEDFIAIYLDGELVNKTTLGLPNGHEPLGWKFGLGFNPNQFGDTIDSSILSLPYHMDIDYIRTYKEEDCLSSYPVSQITGRTVSGDFDQDGVKDEIATFYTYANNQTKAHVWKNTGSSYNYIGTWYDSGINMFDADKITNRIVCGDFDGDGFEDDICAFYDLGGSNTKAYVWKSTGSSFTWPTAFYSSTQGGQGYFNANKITGRVVCGDFDNDGTKDDVCALSDEGSSNTKAYVWKSNGSSFTWPTAFYSSTQGGQGYFNANKATGRVVSGDFDGDGFEDDVCALTDEGGFNTKAYVWKGTGSSFTWPTAFYSSTQGGQGYFDANKTSYRVTSGDFDNDGKKDDICAFYDLGGNNTNAYVWKSTGASFTWPTVFYNSQQGGQAYFDANKITGRVVSGDFDGDGFEDDILAFHQESDWYKSKLYEWEGLGASFEWPNEVWKTCFDNITNYEDCPSDKWWQIFKSYQSIGDSSGFSDIKFGVYPNPFSNETTIRFENGVDNPFKRIEVLNLQGKVFSEWGRNYFREGNNQIVWQTSNLPNGYYIIRVTSANGANYFKVSKLE